MLFVAILVAMPHLPQSLTPVRLDVVSLLPSPASLIVYRVGCKAVAAGMNPLDVRRVIQAAVSSAVDVLKEISQPIM